MGKMTKEKQSVAVWSTDKFQSRLFTTRGRFVDSSSHLRTESNEKKASKMLRRYEQDVLYNITRFVSSTGFTCGCGCGCTANGT